MKNESFLSYIKRMKNSLKPRGDSHLVKLSLKNAGYVDQQIVNDAISKLESLPKTFHLQEPNALEKLAIILLNDSMEG